MLTIHLPESQLKQLNPLYYKTSSRLPTVTDLNIVSDNLVVAIHRFAGKVYLIKVNDDLTTYTILDTLKIKYGNNQYFTEMMVRRDNRLYIITFSEYMVIVDIIGDKLKLIREIKLNNTGNHYHGLTLHNNYLYIVPSIVKNNQLHIIKLGISELLGERLKIEKIITPDFIKNTGKYRIKDISFLENTDGKVLLLVMINNGKTNMKDYNHVDHGFLGLYDNNFIQLDILHLSEIHLDSMITVGNDFYLTAQENTGGFIYKGSININDDKIDGNIKKIKTEGFPHGIDIFRNIFGYTSYSTSSLYLMKFNEISY